MDDVRRWQRRLVGAATVVGALLVVTVAVWVARLPTVEPGPLAAVEGDPSLEVTHETDGDVVLAPVGGAGGTTVVFYPGAGVPPEAYVATWAPVVTATGVTVVVPAVPLRLAVLDGDVAERVRDERTAEEWWLGGHSLGGAMAARHLADSPVGEWDGLVLWAAYPAGDGLAGRTDLTVVSVAGSRDGLTTVDEVEDSRGDLPADATVTILDGVTHAQFGTYGDQRGDGTPTVTDAEARRRIAAATGPALGGDPQPG